MLRNEGFEGAKRADTVLRRQGALLGAGLLDAGGRNTVLQLLGPSGLRREAVASVFLGCQLWEWYPLAQVLVKALVPTMLLGVDASLHMPRDFQLRCLQPESRFAYVEPVKREEKAEKTTVTFSFQEKPRRAALQSSLRRSSTRGRADSETHAARSEDSAENVDMAKSAEAKAAEAAEKSGSAPTSQLSSATGASKPAETSKPSEAVEAGETAAATEDPKKEKKSTTGKEGDAKAAEPQSFLVSNGNRVTLTQMPHMSLLQQRFMPVIAWERVQGMGTVPGVLVVKDTQGGACQYVDLDNGEANVIECPMPFTYHIAGETVSEQWSVCEQTGECTYPWTRR